MYENPPTTLRVQMGHDDRFINKKAYCDFIRLLQKMLIINPLYDEDDIDLTHVYQELQKAPIGKEIKYIDKENDWTDAEDYAYLDYNVYTIFEDRVHPSLFSTSPSALFEQISDTDLFMVPNVTELYQTIFPNQDTSTVSLTQKLQQIDDALINAYANFKQMLYDYSKAEDVTPPQMNNVDILTVTYDAPGPDTKLYEISISYNLFTNNFVKS